MAFTLPEHIFTRYKRAHEHRVGVRNESIQKIRVPFFKAVFGNFIILQLLFFALFCYIFGSLYDQNSHNHNIKILYIDYDGGIIGNSVRTAYRGLQADAFPSLVEMPPQTPNPDAGFLKDEVCKTHYWATLWTHPGASDRLEAALAGGSAAATYNASDVLTYLWNEARYPTSADGILLSNIQTLSAAAQAAYATINGTGAVQALDVSDSAAIAAYSTPWRLTEINLQPTRQGSRAIYNTLCIILLIIQEFFYLASLNGIYGVFKVYERLYPHRIWTFRMVISAGYCFLGALFVTASIWIFRSGWDVNGNQFVLTWMIVWLFAHVNLLWLDVFSVWVPVQFVPMFLITWIVTNVASILLPFELVPGFYHWGYALPAHALYTTQLDIWSGGCFPLIYVNLPVLFAWWVLGLFLTYLGVYRRCHYAVIAQETQEAQFHDKLADAMAFERKHDLEVRLEEKRLAGQTNGSEAVEAAEEEEARDEPRNLEAMAAELRKLDTSDRKELAKMSSLVHFGPSFNNPL